LLPKYFYFNFIAFIWAFIPYQLSYSTYFLSGNIDFYVVLFFMNFYFLSLFLRNSVVKFGSFFYIVVFSITSILLFQGNYFIVLFNILCFFIFYDKSKILEFCKNNLLKILAGCCIFIILLFLNIKFILFSVKKLLSYLSIPNILDSSINEMLFFLKEKIISGYLYYLPLSLLPSQFVYDYLNTKIYFYLFHLLFGFILFLIVFSYKTEKNQILKKLYFLFFSFSIGSLIISLALMPIECVFPLPMFIEKKFHFVYFDKLRYIYPFFYSFFAVVIFMIFRNIFKIQILKFNVNLLLFAFCLVFIAWLWHTTFQTAKIICPQDYRIKRYNNRIKLFSLNSVERNFFMRGDFEILDFLEIRKKIFLNDIRKKNYIAIFDDYHIHGTIINAEIKDKIIAVSPQQILEKIKGTNEIENRKLSDFFAVLFIAAYSKKKNINDIKIIISNFNHNLQNEEILYYYMYYKYFANYDYLNKFGNEIFFIELNELNANYSVSIQFLKSRIKKILSQNFKNDFIKWYLFRFYEHLFKMYSADFKLRNYQYFDAFKKETLKNTILTDDNFSEKELAKEYYEKILNYMTQ
ncbi:MAG TPA: hypothetical protein PLM75_05060, partial [bacterium]|nr:hypothetical protein [bacterium]